MSVCELNRNSLQVFIPCGEFSFDMLEIKEVVQHTDPYFGKPYGGFWTSTLDGDFTTAWSDFLCSDFKSRSVGSKALVFSIAPNARIYDIKNADAYYSLIENYPLETEKGTLLDWVAVSQDFDAVHASCYFPRYWDVESTVWFNLDALIFEGTIGIEEERYIDEYDWSVRKLKLIPESWMHYEVVKVGEIDRGYFGPRDITQIHLRKNPSEHDILFHGSSKKLKTIKPQKHYLADNRPVVFGTPLLEVALTFLQPWTDDDFTQGIVDDEPLHMIEQYPNAFERIFGGASGYIYALDGEPFYSQDNLTRYELISDKTPTILETIYIDDVLQALKESDIQMIKFEDRDTFIENDYRLDAVKNPSEDVYVYSAVPPNSLKTMRKYGLLSGAEVAKNKEVLHLARPEKKSREDFLKRVKSTLKSDYPYNMMGPSVLFTLPDENKITDKHFIKEWNLTPIRINLTQLVLDYPETIIWGAELVPYLHEWRGLSDEEFEEALENTLGYDDWRKWKSDRSHQLSLSDVNAYGSMSPKELWQYYSLDDAGKYYAANVPHAFIITPMGTIPYEYIDFL